MRTNQEVPEPLWDSATTAAFLGIPERTLDEWSYRRCGPPFRKIGRHRRYRPAEVQAWVDRQARGGAA